MHIEKIKNILSLDGDHRFAYFVRKVSDFQIVWGLFKDGWALTSDGTGNVSIPFWPEKEFAELCAQDVWDNYKPMAIELNDFLLKWLPGMNKDQIMAAIFPIPVNKGVVVNPIELMEYIEKELAQYS